MVHMPAAANPAYEAYVAVFDVTEYGADRTGTVVANDAIATAWAAAAAVSGSAVFLPPGTYMLERDGAAAWCLDLSGDVTLLGVPGKTVIKAEAGMPAESISLLHFDEQENITIRDVIFDGNWGATTGVTTTQTGINHSTQVDPKSHAVVLRGTDNVLIENCIFQNMYGDGVWLGAAADDDLTDITTQVTIRKCRFDLCARNGISFGAPAHGVTIDDCYFNDIYTSAIDAEPQGGPFNGCRNVVINNCHLRGWWNWQYNNLMISAPAGDPTGYNIGSAARTWRITNNRIYGSIYVAGGLDVVIRDNYFYNETSDAAYALAPIWISHCSDQVLIEGNTIYDDATKSAASGGPHNGAIQIAFGSNGDLNAQPIGVTVRDNKIFARNGVHGIWVNSPGGFTRADSTAVVSATSGTATASADASVTHTGAGWTVNRYAGWTITMGGKQALILSNTSEVLTLQPAYSGVIASAWFTPIGEMTTAPSHGAYTISSKAGLVDIEGNAIDCGADGNAAGGDGIYLFNDRAGGRIRVANNAIKNVTSYGVFVVGAASKPVLLLEIVDNKCWDDQAVATSSAAIRFADAGSLTSIVKVIMRGNALVGGMSTLLSGVSAGVWLVQDGDVQIWTGYDAPSHTAAAGSLYLRKNPDDATSALYVNTDGATTWSAR